MKKRFQTKRIKKVLTVVDTYFKKNEEKYKMQQFNNNFAGKLEAHEYMCSMNNKWDRVQENKK